MSPKYAMESLRNYAKIMPNLDLTCTNNGLPEWYMDFKVRLVEVVFRFEKWLKDSEERLDWVS